MKNFFPPSYFYLEVNVTIVLIPPISQRIEYDLKIVRINSNSWFDLLELLEIRQVWYITTTNFIRLYAILFRLYLQIHYRLYIVSSNKTNNRIQTTKKKDIGISFIYWVQPTGDNSPGDFSQVNASQAYVYFIYDFGRKNQVTSIFSLCEYYTMGIGYCCFKY